MHATSTIMLNGSHGVLGSVWGSRAAVQDTGVGTFLHAPKVAHDATHRVPATAFGPASVCR